MELTVNIAAYCYRGVDRYDVAFFYQELARFVAEFADLWFWYRPTCAQLGNCPVQCEPPVIECEWDETYRSKSLIL